jgi:hypothetical protein
MATNLARVLKDPVAREDFKWYSGSRATLSGGPSNFNLGWPELGVYRA